LIEANDDRFAELSKLYASRPDVHCIKTLVQFEGPSCLDSIFATTPLPLDFDLLVIDVDGCDYHVWDSLQRYNPRVVVIEFNPTIPNNVAFVQTRDMSVYQGSSLRALMELAQRKGYDLVCTTIYNAFFVRREFYPLFHIADNAIDVMHDTPMPTEFFQLYDGTLMLTGCKKLLWHKVWLARF